MSLRSAVIARWNFAGLDSSIDKLFPYSGKGIDLVITPASQQSVGGNVVAPALEAMPRCRLILDQEVPQGETADESLFSRNVFLYVIHTVLTTLETYKALIEPAFENSHRFSTNPFAMTGCTVTEVTPLGADEHIREKACFLEVAYHVEYHRARRLPT